MKTSTPRWFKTPGQLDRYLGRDTKTVRCPVDASVDTLLDVADEYAMTGRLELSEFMVSLADERRRGIAVSSRPLNLSRLPSFDELIKNVFDVEEVA